MRAFRRRRPLHERLADEGGLTPEPEPLEPPDFLHRLAGAGIHGLQRQREWDAVVAVEAPPLSGDRVVFVCLPDRTILVEEGEELEDLAPLAEAVEAELEPPYRGVAIRRHETLWAVAASRVEVVELEDDPGGDDVTFTVRDGERELLVDGARSFGGAPELEQLAEGRFESFAVQATRLDGSLWEVELSAL